MTNADHNWTSGLVPLIQPHQLADILSQVSDLALFISPTGDVTGAMSNPSFLPSADFSSWVGTNLSEQLTVESIPKLKSRLGDIAGKGGASHAVELNHAAHDSYPEFPMRYSFHPVDGGKTVLMLGRDLRPVAEMQQQLVSAQIALEKDYEAQREFDTRFRVLMTSSSEIIIFANAGTGTIIDCNTSAAHFFGRTYDDLVGKNIAKLFEAKSQAGLIRDLIDADTSDSSSTITAAIKGTGSQAVIHPTLFRSAGERIMLCRINPGDDLPVRSNELHDNLITLYRDGVDAIVFVNATGGIMSANPAFFTLADVTHEQSIRGRSISDFMSRGSVDLNVLLENTARSGSMRLYATRLVGEHGTERPIEVSTTRLGAHGDHVFALIIRDASRVETLRTPASQMTEADMRSVIELIGSQTLKDIVASTTDVVEKMCIETAVELTSNNRVAAAEMLGLSRQSLYVKLRKYDLL
ncbi:MAG: transcriptional regulator PpsR [Pseudomonadota bacterium]